MQTTTNSNRILTPTDLNPKIEHLRNLLNVAVMNKNHQEAMHISTKLDKLILETMSNK